MQLVKVVQVFKGYSLCGTFERFRFFDLLGRGCDCKEMRKKGLSKQAKARCAITLQKETLLSALIIIKSN